MSKRGMRAAGACLAAVAVMSGSAAANGEVEAPDPALKFAAEDFTVTFSATPARVVLSPDGGKTKARYRIVVTHPRSIDQVDSVRLGFEQAGESWLRDFWMDGWVIRQPSATKTVLLGRTDFSSKERSKWVTFKGRASPGIYTPVRAGVQVTDDGEVSYTEVVPPTGRLHILDATKTALHKPSIQRGRARLEGRVVEYNGSLDAASTRQQWSGLPNTRLDVLFLRRGATQPRVVATTKTDSNGRYSLRHEVHRPGRWWVRFPGNSQLDASRSVGYQVSASS